MLDFTRDDGEEISIAADQITMIRKYVRTEHGEKNARGVRPVLKVVELTELSLVGGAGVYVTADKATVKAAIIAAKG